MMVPTALVADESRGTRQLLTRQLRAFGWQTVETSDGLETLDHLTEADVDLLVLDVGLRFVNGVEVLAALRQSPRYAELPAIAFGMTDEATLQSLTALGIEDFLVKPFNTDFLRERLLRFPPRKNVRARNAKLRASAAPGGTAVVVDADAQFRDFAAKVLAGKYAVVEAASGAAALRACLAHRPALVLAGGDTGLLNPRLLAGNLKKRGEMTQTRMLLVVSSDQAAEARAEPGFAAVLTKTFVIDDFERQLSRAMGRSLVGGSPALTEIRLAIESATRQALGMMAGCDVRVAAYDARTRTAGPMAQTSLTVPDEGVTVRLALGCDAAGGQIVAASVLGAAPEDLTPEDGLAALGELVNVIAGRVKSSQSGHKRPISFTIPELVSDSTPGAGLDFEVCLEVEPVDQSFRLILEMGVLENAAVGASRAEKAA